MPKIMIESKHTELFLSVISAHKGIIYKIANAYCKSEDDRLDLVQEIIAQIWISFSTYDSRYKYSTWIYRISLNVSISSYRKEHRRKEISNPIEDSNILYLSESSYDDETDLKLWHLNKFIAGLTHLDKALILLYLDDRSHKEIAEIMDISISNVATKIARIKDRLKQKFSQVENQSWKS